MGEILSLAGGAVKCWYLLYCKSGFKNTIRRLNELGVEVYQPTMVKVQLRTDCHSVRLKEKPLFNNYLFLSFDINQLHTTTICQVPGAIGFVRFGSEPCVVSPDVISAIECAKAKALNNDDGSVDCINVHPALILKIQDIVKLRSSDERMAEFTKLLSFLRE
ncbi:transcription termination/antitermination NusG family protein [Enterobacter sp. UPMP2060]